MPPARAPTAKRVELRWAPADRYPRLTVLVIVGALAALALALFGLPPIDIHEPAHYLGIMGPSCGMTRAVRWLARGDLARAWRFNPAVFVLAAWAAAVALRAAAGRLTGRWIELHLRGRNVTTVAVTGLALLWVNQQLHAAFIMSAR
jgi:uncharacterized protein DUF2752